MRHSAFRLLNSPAVPPGQLRLTRLNIYSGLYLEWSAARIVIDPAKMIPDLISQIEPDLMLVSHESMDHFEPELCLRWLERSRAVLVGSWGTIAALAGLLPRDDSRWKRIYAAVPGTEFEFGEVKIRIHASLHCEYAAPIFFEIIDSRSGWRLIDLIDTAKTEELQARKVVEGCDLLIVPLGIALGASAQTAWELVELLRPRRLMPGHFNGDPAGFVALARTQYKADDLYVCHWHEGVTLSDAGDPAIAPTPRLTNRFPWVSVPAATDEPAQMLQAGTDERTLVNALYATAWATLLHGPTVHSEQRLARLHDSCLQSPREGVSAAYLLALGVTLAKRTTSSALTLEALLSRLDPARPYYSYWILECCGRAAENPGDREFMAEAFNRIASDETLFASEPIRRKYMWEVFRLVQLGHRWPGLNDILWKTFGDPNPDVRLLAFKTLPLCAAEVPSWRDLLAQGCHDSHEDVLEWVVNASVDLLPSVQSKDSAVLNEQLPKLLTHAHYHVRLRSNVLAELVSGEEYGRAARA